MNCRFPIGLLFVMIGLSIGRADDKSGIKLLAERISFLSRKAQNYSVQFSAIPDKDRFQIRRIPTAKWPRGSNFFVALGETSADQQFRVDGLRKNKWRKPTDGNVD